MTPDDLIAELFKLSLEDKMQVRAALFDMIDAHKKYVYQTRPCDHPKHRIRERKMYNGSIDLVCGRCGQVVERL